MRVAVEGPLVLSLLRRVLINGMAERIKLRCWGLFSSNKG